MGSEVERRLVSGLPDIEVTRLAPEGLSEDAIGVIRCEAQCSQAMVDKDLGALRSLTMPDLVFTHMSGMRQTREEYLADIASGRLTYRHIEIQGPRVSVWGDVAQMQFTSVLTATAYGARGTFPMRVGHWFRRTQDGWRIASRPKDAAGHPDEAAGRTKRSRRD